MLKIIKEIIVVLYSWLFIMLAFYSASHLESSLYGFMILSAVIFYRIRKNEDEEYLKEFRKYFWIFIFLLLLIGFFRVSPESSPSKSDAEVTKEISKPTKQEETNHNNINVDWERKVKKIAKLKLTETEKFAEVMKIAVNYTVSDEEYYQFAKYILKEHEGNKYFNKLSNDEYALKAIFVSYVLTEDNRNQTVSQFAFDFHQNSKYIYRKVDTPSSHDTVENSYQLDKNRGEVELFVGYDESEENNL